MEKFSKPLKNDEDMHFGTELLQKQIIRKHIKNKECNKSNINFQKSKGF